MRQSSSISYPNIKTIALSQVLTIRLIELRVEHPGLKSPGKSYLKLHTSGLDGSWVAITPTNFLCDFRWVTLTGVRAPRVDDTTYAPKLYRGTRYSQREHQGEPILKPPPQNPKKGSMRGGVDDEDDDDGGSDDNGARRRRDLYLHAVLLLCKIKKNMG